MPRAHIITELKSLIQANPHLNKSVTGFTKEMQSLKKFYQEHEKEDIDIYFHHAQKVFQQWTIQELMLFVALFGNKNLAKILRYSEDSPACLLEKMFIFEGL